MRSLRRFPEVQQVARNGELSLLVTLHGRTTPTVVNLHNHVREIGRAGDDVLADRLHRVLLSVAEMEVRPSSFEEAEPRLLASVRARSYLSATVSAEMASPANPLLYHVIAPLVVELVAIDSDHGMTFVTEEDAVEWGTGWHDVASVARRNLALAGTSIGPLEGLGGVFEVLEPDSYQSAWLALPDLLLEMGARLGLTAAARLDDPEPLLLVLAPARDVLWLLNDTDASRIIAAVERAIDVFQESPRGISPVPYVVGTESVRPWEPPLHHASVNAVASARRVLEGTEYGYQQRALDGLFERSQEDVFVAGYNVIHRDDGTAYSWAVWVQGVEVGLIPRTEFVMFVGGEDDEPIAVAWNDVVRIAAAAFERDPALEPPRWRASGWPAPDVVELLAAAAVDPDASGA